MGKYDNIFNSEDKSTESLNQEEGVAAIAVITTLWDSQETEIDTDYLIDLLWETELYDDYSDDELAEMVDKLFYIAEEEGLGALFNAAYDSLSDELLPDAFAAGVMMLIDESGVIPPEQDGFIKELQQALELEDEEAQAIIDEVVATFNEVAEEEEDEDSDEDYVSDAQYAKILEEQYDRDASSQEQEVYESPTGNFSVPVPVDPRKGGRVSEQEGTVGFSDDFGRLLRIDYYPFSAEAAEELKSVGREEYLRTVLVDNYVAQAIIANLPQSKVEHTEYLEDTMDGAYCVVVDMPQGSTLSKQTNDEPAVRLDALRGLLAFPMDDFLYVVSCQRTFFEGESVASIEQEVEGLKYQILEFLDTVEFT